jgi:RNA polymerase sigma-70 factor (ECF subfamily)
MRRHFRENAAVEVVVEQRGHDRRRMQERRTAAAEPEEDRRRIRAADGRRVADRRTPVVVAPVPAGLPRRARPHVEQLVWLERVEPSAQRDEDLDTARLVTRIQAGESDLFVELYMRYFDRVYGYLRVVLDDPHEAEDAAQQAFLNAMAALPRYERRGQPFRAWLFTIVRNQSLNSLRERRRPVDLVDPSELAYEHEIVAPDDHEETLSWISDRELVMLLERLPLAQRQALFLRFQLDLSAPAIAEIMERSADDVRMLQHRALRFLHDRLAALGRASEAVPRIRARGRLREATVLRARRFAIYR